MSNELTRREPEEAVKVMVIDVLPSVIEGTRRLLEMDPRFNVWGYTEVDRAIAELAVRDFYCILIDLSFPNVINAIKKLSAYNPLVFVYTDEDPSPYFNRLVDAGVMGFIYKTSDSNQLLQELSQALRGQSNIPIRLLRELRRIVAYIEDGKGMKREAITEREEQVLQYLALGYTLREIAGTLYVSLRSIEKTIADLYRKFGVSSRRELLQKARQAKLLPQVSL
ncbi:response regulator containing a CheY-like receiver domain and an HTH DNA-binding domain [Thermobacillus composti KWC4]|uniref:Response regulator containing a CheY-like receiver domain and an HTH DNA-binding domain n=2 Tax=Thermobacillus TaxID=76632 RepID=L0EI42_THECK|nr:response regulator containing a CheY-like receiver domain and an HTH DNA-binding domain [Thermobacillus composti KWC4]